MQLTINEKQQELKSHGSFEFPVNISPETLSAYERGAFIWHWHPEVELTLVLDGQISYQVNDRICQLAAGDGLFCNSNALHTGHMIDGSDCHYLSVTFHPRIIYGFEGSILQRNYVSPLLKNDRLDSIVFRPDITWHCQVMECMNRIRTLFLSGHSTAYEMLIQQQLSSIWLLIYQNTQNELIPVRKNSAHSQDTDRIRRILTFIQEHYMDKITLDDIAGQINICKSECCRFFKKYMQESLFDYLLYYRIEKSLPLLTENRLSITEIAEQTGFSNSGYFSRVFREQMNCTPSQYRKRSSEASFL
ncbi:MAG: AraC family transcriptional regulator [Candidatus Choladocola sp.]|nr:AraC family transcriptional regulator [Candidatus Choladocola sp.]